jgi:diguanylate cyclase (GGDEF)-like protein/PAS domain S-box-containing protein
MPIDASDNNTPLARILLVDDDQRMLNSLRALLTAYGYWVEVASSGMDGIDRLGRESYDLVLLDLRMPGISGHDVMRHISSHDIDICVIVVSGETSLDDISRALRNGAYDYLKKPYVPEELLATINNAIRKRRLEDQSRDMQTRLDRSERLHRFIVNNSPDLIFTLDETGNFSFINGQIENLLGYTAAGLLGHHISSIVGDEDLEKMRFLLSPLFQGKHDHRTEHILFKPRQPEQSLRHFELAMWPIVDTDELRLAGHGYHIYGMARDISDRMEAEALISFQTYHDQLTQLPNRALFNDRLSVAINQAKHSGQRPTVIFIDLARFKVINDSLGHSVGDRLLQVASQRLSDCIRSGDTLSRFGGDEFTLLLHDAHEFQLVQHKIGKIFEALRRPFNIDGHELHVDASIGVATYPDGGDSSEALIKNAGIAMYHAKNSGRDFQIFEREMNADTDQRLMLEQELRRCLELGQLQIHYQPQLDCVSERLVGVEALIRWNHPTLGQVSPGVFIPIAEHSRLILQMDRRTLQLACREIRALHRQGLPELLLSINLSPLLVKADDFAKDILDILEQESFPPERLELELTENLLLSDQRDVVEKLLTLHNAGVRIAIDDFGTGYSSLSYLQKFPISTLKIDRSFINSIDGSNEACIVNAIVSMAQGLKLRVVAEGVEHQAQLEYLRTVGCPVAQGFLFDPARPLAEIVARYAAEAATA